MPHAPEIYGWKTPFYLSTSRAIVCGKNNARGLVGLDQSVKAQLNKDDGADRDHGICCGISAAWVVAFCNGHEGATYTGKFELEFFEVMRFQGSYVKAFQGNLEGSTGMHLVEMFSGPSFGAPVKLKKTRQTSHLRRKDTPSGTWAAYMKVPGHAIACGQNDAAHFIMEPNRGLFRYTDSKDWKNDLNSLIHYRNTYKKKPGSAPVSFWFYKAA